MPKEKAEKKVEDRTLILIVIILALIALPGFFMIMYMPAMMGYGFMNIGYGFFPIWIINIAIVVLVIYLIVKSINR